MRKERKYSLRFTIASLVVVLLLATVAGVLVISFLIRRETIAATAESLQTEISTRITERVIERFAPVPGLLRGLRDSVLAGRLEQTNEALLGHLTDRMRYEKRVEWMAWIRPDGSGVGAVAHEDGLLAIRIEAGALATLDLLAQDGSRTRLPDRDMQSLQQAPWVVLAEAADGPVWSKIYKRPFDGQPARACAIAVRDGEQLLGVFGTGFGVEFMRTYLNSVRVGTTGAVFALGPDGSIRSSPNDEALARMGPAVAQAVQTLSGTPAELEAGALTSVAVTHDGVDFHVGLSRQAPEGLPGWVHAIVVPDDELVGYFGGYLLIGLAAIAILLVIAIALAQLLSRRVAGSLDLIAADLERIGSFDLSERPAARTIIREIAVVGDATQRMKASLRSFGRYVPTELVRDLLAQGQEARLGGVERPLTIFFSDVAGFTGSSEGMAPSALVDALGEYLDVLTKAVEQHVGTIDKFIGDGVLAFFNAPRDDADHIVHACHAALAVQAALQAAAPGWQARGLPDFTTRIGLHTAEVVVGNIGTPERFAYTVIGDGVNLAARLEALNKAYGTAILTSEEVRAAAGDAFVWRPIDRTAVVGRKTGGTVYELLGHTGAVDAAVADRGLAYESTLALYFERRFDEAAEAFAALAPDDPASAALGARARAYAAAPPPADWSGVFVQTKK